MPTPLEPTLTMDEAFRRFASSCEHNTHREQSPEQAVFLELPEDGRRAVQSYLLNIEAAAKQSEEPLAVIRGKIIESIVREQLSTAFSNLTKEEKDELSESCPEVFAEPEILFGMFASPPARLILRLYAMLKYDDCAPNDWYDYSLEAIPSLVKSSIDVCAPVPGAASSILALMFQSAASLQDRMLSVPPKAYVDPSGLRTPIPDIFSESES